MQIYDFEIRMKLSRPIDSVGRRNPLAHSFRTAHAYAKAKVRVLSVEIPSGVPVAGMGLSWRRYFPGLATIQWMDARVCGKKALEIEGN